MAVYAPSLIEMIIQKLRKYTLSLFCSLDEGERMGPNWFESPTGITGNVGAFVNEYE